jgi:uncharacterized protein with von Willebrand factor type A (vWA) domain
LFGDFFYKLRDKGVPVTPTSFLKLQKALSMGLITSLDDFYTAGRSILVKSERYFDTYDQIFGLYFRGIALKDPTDVELTELIRAMLEEWLRTPEDIAAALGIDKKKLDALSIEELINYFLEKLKEQKEAHHGGDKWIGTKGTSPLGNMGEHPTGMRILGTQGKRSAVKVALERRFKEYSQEGPLSVYQIGEALKRLRNMIPTGPMDVVNIDKTIYETMRNAGEIEIIFDRRLLDRLKIVLMIDNGGYSMDPYVDLIQTLFTYARAQFKDLKIYYFHNTIYGRVWADPQRIYKPEPVDEFPRKDPDTRIIVVGDASMAPYELSYSNGSVYVGESDPLPSIERIKFIAKTFRHIAWLNPVPALYWDNTLTIQNIREFFPMFELTLDGLEKAVKHLVSRH